MQISGLISSDKEIEIDYPELEGFKVKIAYLSNDKLSEITKEATVHKYNKKTRQMDQDIDDSKFREEYCKTIIKGWSGFKLKHLKELAPVNLGDANLEEEIEFNTQNASDLVKNSKYFDNWISEVSSDVANFN